METKTDTNQLLTLVVAFAAGSLIAAAFGAGFLLSVVVGVVVVILAYIGRK